MSNFLRRRMRGLLRNTFSAPNSSDGVCSIASSAAAQSCNERCDEAEEEEELLMMLGGDTKASMACRTGPSNSSSTSAVVYERILNGKKVRKLRSPPEVYSGKTGLDLPTIHVAVFSAAVKACHTGPDGGLTKVQPMRQRAIAKMAKLDDEEFSLSSMDEDDEKQPAKNGRRKKAAAPAPNGSGALSKSAAHADSMEALGFGPGDGDVPASSSLAGYDWNDWDEERAYGLSTSLYEKHPLTGASAGHPIADVFGIIARENNAILALADGVNWGEGARLAARCAIRGAIDHLNAAIERHIFNTTNDVFHTLLGAFHAAHALILQESGALTTLCVALIAPVRDSPSSVLCSCNVGDSLCFVFSDAYGVREVTLASHDIAQMRDMRDAGGALGPVDGRNPQLQNLTCSMTFVEDGDLVFITSDGISDNFDPVVGKFCVIKRPNEDSAEKENTESGLSQKGQPSAFHKTKSAPPSSTNGLLHFSPIPSHQCRSVKRPPAATLPCVDAFERHELMLLRMGDVIPNGLSNNLLMNGGAFASNPPNALQNGHTPNTSNGSPNPSLCSSSNGSAHRHVSASELCRNLVQFSYQLSSAKRRTLEDPELYRTRTHSKTEERLRRKVIRDMIMEMPGKLDHASVVAYRVGKWAGEEERQTRREKGQANGTSDMETFNGILLTENGGEPNDYNEHGGELTRSELAKNFGATPFPTPPTLHSRSPYEEMKPSLGLNCSSKSTTASTCSTAKCEEDGAEEDERDPTQQQQITRSVIENRTDNKRVKQQLHSKHRHGRGSVARHTLGVDVSWLKRLVTSKHEQPAQQQNGEVPQLQNGGTAPTNEEDPVQSHGNTRKQHLRDRILPTVDNSTANNEKLNGASGGVISLRKLRGAFSRQPDMGSQHYSLPPTQTNTPRDQFMSTDPEQQIRIPIHCSPALPPRLTNEEQQNHPPAVPRMGLGQLNGNSQMANGPNNNVARRNC